MILMSGKMMTGSLHIFFSMTDPITAIIVDDERLARKGLRLLLEDHPRLTVIDEADNVDNAVAIILEARRPDVVFLDIQMPGETGFDLLDRVAGPWHIIFVTAYDAYAIRAFEVNALDYLLKPVHPARLARSIERLDDEQTSKPAERPLEYNDHRFVTLDNQTRFLKINTIARVRAAGYYTQGLLTDGHTGPVLQALKAWETRLPDKHFARIHRSMVINFDAIKRIEPWFNHACRIYLISNDEPVTTSRR